MNNGHNLAVLASVLQKSDNWLELDPTARYQEVTVRLWGRGVTLRGERLGSEIGTRRLAVRPRQFILSRIDARNGAFGLVPDELDGAVVSNDFPSFECRKDRLLPEYLGWLSKTGWFTEACRSVSEGTTNRVRLKEDKFLRLKIFLPPLSEQQRVVAKIERLAARVEETQRLRAECNVARDRLPAAETTAIFDELNGINPLPIRCLGVGGTNPVQTGPFGAQLHKSEFTSDGVPVLNVGNVWPEGLRLDRMDYVTPDKAQQLSRYSVGTDDLLFARSGATLGKVCVVPRKCDGWLMTGHLFRVRFDKKRCDPNYAFVALRHAKSVREQVFGQVRGATRPGFNTTLLGNVQLPLPPLQEQHRIVAYLNGRQAKVDQLKRLQQEVQAKLDALLPTILDRAFKGGL